MGINRVILHGGGGHARVVLDCLLSSGIEVSGIYDSMNSGDLFGIPFLGPYTTKPYIDAHLIIAIGNNEVRKRLTLESRHEFTNAVHSSAIISRFSSIGTGNMILHRAVVQAKCIIGNHVIINTGAQVDHDCTVGDFAHLAPGSVLCGSVSVGEGTLVGAGAVVIPGRRIGAWATIGAGAVVTDDIPDFAVAVGTPARILKYNKNG